MLCSAVLRCQARRLLALGRSAPLLSAAAVIAVAAAPWPLAQAGAELGRALGPALGAQTVARALVAGLALAGAAAGAALAVSCPGRQGLGPQLAAGPVGSCAALLALTLAPTAVALLPVLPSVLAFMLPFAARTPGGAVSGGALVLAAVAGSTAGAVLAEAAVHASRGRVVGAISAAVVVPAWIALGAGLGAPALGPLTLVAGAVAGTVAPVVALASAALTSAGLAALWLAMGCRRPERRRRARARMPRLVHGRGVVAVAAAVLALVLRRRDLRLAALAALTFGLGGVSVGAASGAPPPAPLLLGATSALLGVALIPLALPGAVVAGRWAWACAPRRLPAPLSALLVSLAVLAASLAPVVLCALIVSSGAPATVATLAVLTVIVAAAALVAGIVVPWRGGGVGDQLASFGAFAACGAGASAGVGLAGPRLVAAGVPVGVAAAMLGCAALTAAACALGYEIERPR